MKMGKQQILVVLAMPSLLAAIAACAPIDATTTTEERLVAEDLRQTPVGDELSVETKLVGSDPRSDAEIVVDVTERHRCEEQTIEIYKRHEVTERSIDDWWYPVGLGALAIVSFGCMAGHLAESGCLPEEDDDGEPLVQTSSEHRVAAGFFGAMGVGSVAIIGIDLGRTRTSVERLEDRDKALAPSKVYCGDVPASGVQVEVVEHEGGRPWSGKTDRSGRVVIPVSELNWLTMEEERPVARIDVQGTAMTSLAPPPQPWMEVRTKVVVERVFEAAGEKDSAEGWFQAWEIIYHTDASAEAFWRFVEAMDEAIDRSKRLGQLETLLAGAYRLDPSKGKVEELRRLDAELFVQKARSGAREAMGAGEVVAAYNRARDVIDDDEKAETIRKEALSYALEAMDEALEDDDFDAEHRRELMELAEEGDRLVEYSHERERLERRTDRLGQRVVAGELSRARKLRDASARHRSEAVDAYQAAMKQARRFDDPSEETIGEELRQLFLGDIAEAVDSRARHRADRVFDNAQAKLDDQQVEKLHDEYFELVLEGFRDTIASGGGVGMRTFDDWVTSLADEDDDVRILEATLGGLVELADEGAARQGASWVGELREAFDEFQQEAETPEVEAVVAEKSEELRTRLRRRFSVGELQSKADVRWLYPPTVSVDNAMARPGSHIGQRTMVTVRIVEAIGQGNSLATVVRSGDTVLLSGAGQSVGQTTTVLARVEDTVTDARGGGTAEIPKLHVLWRQ